MFSKELIAPLVDILWDDADATAAWTTEIDEEESLVHTVGFLIKETKTAYYVSHTVYNDEEGTLTWNGRIRIPKGMIRSYEVIKEVG